MSRYKLIKTYPFSPELGTIVFKVSDLKNTELVQYTYDRFSSTKLSKDEVENYPEFWQPEEEWRNEEDITNLSYEFNKYDIEYLSAYDSAVIAEKYFRMKYKLYERTT